MSVGIYSALGWWTPSELDAAHETLREVCTALQSGDGHPLAGEAAPLIRAFEERVGARCALQVELVSTPQGPALEVGNLGHIGFGREHEAAALEVAQALARILVAVGATRAVPFTMD